VKVGSISTECNDSDMNLGPCILFRGKNCDRFRDRSVQGCQFALGCHTATDICEDNNGHHSGSGDGKIFELAHNQYGF
jgi:hypothetical protein